MKKFLITMAVAATSAAAMVSCSSTSSSNFKMEGSIVNPDAKMMYIYLTDSLLNMTDIPSDSVAVENGKFSYALELSEPKLARIQSENIKGSLPETFAIIPVVPGENVVLTMNPEENSFQVSGSEFYTQMQSAMDFINKYKEQSFDLQNRMMLAQLDSTTTDSTIMALQDEATELERTITEDITSFLDSHSNDDGVIMGTMIMTGDFDTVFGHAGDKFKTGRFSKIYNFVIEQEKNSEQEKADMEAAAKVALENTKEGNMFVDFEAEYNGKVQKLSDYVGKGKYVLVDFWASWCGPCKAEIPNLINVYNKYKGSKFDVLGIATWDKPEESLAVIEQMGIPYSMILNSKDAGSNAYGILSIPQIILFAPDGTILKRDLRGAEIEAAVKKALKK